MVADVKWLHICVQISIYTDISSQYYTLETITNGNEHLISNITKLPKQIAKAYKN
jgi:hypothetical protein